MSAGPHPSPPSPWVRVRDDEYVDADNTEDVDDANDDVDGPGDDNIDDESYDLCDDNDDAGHDNPDDDSNDLHDDDDEVEGNSDEDVRGYLTERRAAVYFRPE